MQRTCSAAVLTIVGALALVTLPATPAGADDSGDLVRRAGAAVDAPVPCPDAVSIPAGDGVAFYVGDCPPEQTATTGAAATAEPARVPTTTSSTTLVVPPPPPSGGASLARPATTEAVADPGAAQTGAAPAATIEGDDAPLVMLFALALLAVVLLGISRLRSERP